MKKRIMTLFIILGIVITTGCGTKKETTNDTNNQTKSKLNYEKIANDVMTKYYENVFNTHSNLYCGEVDRSDTNKDKVRVKNYNSIDEINKTFQKYLSERFISENLSNHFVESNGKLYCKENSSSGLEYDPNSLEIIVINNEFSKVELDIRYSTIATSMNEPMTFNARATLVMEKLTWVLDEYMEY